ncbi:shikimate kinase [Mucilaginibacter sp. BJC16-A38]|uniref:shikimate kinase n=1 Tax=Mucilaginibacter phenanthrenivorans TaxID=1234842 RepID=UPI002157E17E|nr:shikimate kinase [Mucilaginibacter phenanthrenivorans]MCR8561263.1 shikimate kinase [Mucilaginibacter phenanthrenivorans]
MSNSEDKGLGLIFLIGFMGCGKTTLGRKLASRLGYEFMDLDHILEAQAGMSIAEYFSSFGEDAFRKLESEVLKQTKYPEHAVISTGGGLPCFFDNMEWINAHGRSLYIQLSPKTLADRLEHEKVTRPLLRDKHGDALIAFIGEKLLEREPFYKQATVTANGLSLTAEKVVEMLLV